MRSVNLCIFVLASIASAKVYEFDDPKNPIKRVETSIGRKGLERIDRVYAEIYPSHLSKKRTNFAKSGALGKKFKQISEPGDERGHLVGSQFSGPAKWYNLSPQSAQVNRNAGRVSILTDWYKTEAEVAHYLKKGGQRFVKWSVDNSHHGSSNRPHEHDLRVHFFKDGKELRGRAIHAKISNPKQSETSRFRICQRRNNRRRGKKSKVAASAAAVRRCRKRARG